jgi:ribosome-associated translation inhibitor RaiA
MRVINTQQFTKQANGAITTNKKGFIMLKIHFKDLEPSEMAREIVTTRLGDMISKFPDLQNHNMTCTLSGENTPTQAGPDLFKIKLILTGKKFSNIVIEKKAPHLYLAIALLCESLLERLNRATDKSRIKKLRQARNSKKLDSSTGIRRVV